MGVMADLRFRADASWGLARSSPRAVGMIVRESSVPVDGGRLHVRETGSGQPVVLVHGGPDFDDEYLLPEMWRLGDRFRVITYAQRGRGRSFDGSDPAHAAHR